jgi:Raf kinase inhibitor-like YbhB/YbcL family protein
MNLMSDKHNWWGARELGWLLIGCVTVCGSCSRAESPLTSEAEKTAMKIEITSSAFTEGNPIPIEYTCDGSDVSPDLKWGTLPPETRSLALVCDDPDAPSGTFVHWVMYAIPPTENQLQKGVPKIPTLPNGTKQGTNGFGRIGYGGPCPPRGAPHHYFFRIYALDTRIDQPGGMSRAQLDQAMKGHIVAEGHVMGTYQRK